MYINSKYPVNSSNLKGTTPYNVYIDDAGKMQTNWQKDFDFLFRLLHPDKAQLLLNLQPHESFQLKNLQSKLWQENELFSLFKILVTGKSCCMSHVVS